MAKEVYSARDGGAAKGNGRSNTRNLLREDSEELEFWDSDEYLVHVVESSKASPSIHDDTLSWDAFDEFDYYQNVSGEYYDTVEYIKKYTEGKGVAGWFSTESFDGTDKKVPEVVKSIMKGSKPDVPYKKNNQKFEVWKGEDNGFNMTVMRFMYERNKKGTVTPEFWTMVAVDYKKNY